MFCDSYKSNVVLHNQWLIYLMVTTAWAPLFFMSVRSLLLISIFILLKYIFEMSLLEVHQTGEKLVINSPNLFGIGEGGNSKNIFISSYSWTKTLQGIGFSVDNYLLSALCKGYPSAVGFQLQKGSCRSNCWPLYLFLVLFFKIFCLCLGSCFTRTALDVDFFFVICMICCASWIWWFFWLVLEVSQPFFLFLLRFLYYLLSVLLGCILYSLHPLSSWPAFQFPFIRLYDTFIKLCWG